MSKRKNDKEESSADDGSGSESDNESGSGSEDEIETEEKEEAATTKKKPPVKRAGSSTAAAAGGGGAKPKQTKKPAKKRAKKDPNAPKNPTTAYMYYSKQKRTELKEKNKNIQFGELSRQISQSWKELTDDDKKPFVKLHAIDKERFQKEMQNYTKPSDSESDSEESSSDDDKKGKGKKKKKAPAKKKKARKKRDPNAPKAAANAYMLFQKDQREKIKKDHPNIKAVTEIAKLVGKSWREMSDEDKAPYVQQASQDKLRYQKEMEDYQKEKDAKDDDKDDKDEKDDDDDGGDDWNNGRKGKEKL